MDGINEKLTVPQSDEIEVTLIGGTSGYGESILIHIGDGDWIVVDSCVNAQTGDCVPLTYLEELEVDVAEHLLYVICTHWHEDHIKGLSKIMEKCTSKTVFAISCSDDREKFVYELLQDYNYDGKSVKLQELTQSLKLAEANHIVVQRLKQNEFIFNRKGVQAYALSPSEKVVKKFEEELATAQKNYQKVLKQLLELKTKDPNTIEDAQNLEKDTIDSFKQLIKESIDEESIIEETESLLKYKDTKKIEPNDRCVTIQVTFNNHHIILGADLENHPSPNGMMGWMDVAASPSLNGVTSSLFKIPHHGSETGYCEYFLKKFIKTDAVMKLTAWIRGDKVVPEKEMLLKYYNHSPNLYVSTTSMFKKGNNEEDVSIRKQMDNTTDLIYEIKPQLGIIRSRINKNSFDDIWKTEYFGSAEKISSKHF